MSQIAAPGVAWTSISKRRAGVVAGLGLSLSDDLLVEILSRVPAKSLCRFNCVCKAWRDLIADTLHRKKLPQVMEGFFFMDDLIHCVGSSRGCEEAEQQLTLVDLAAARSVPLDIDPSFSFLTELPGVQIITLEDSCNGLLPFRQLSEPLDPGHALSYIVCNPTTKHWGCVPTFPSPLQTADTYLAFDLAVSSHFHVVQFKVEDENELMPVHIYSSESGTSSHIQTSTNEQEERGQLEGCRFGQMSLLPNLGHWCAFVNGILHFILMVSFSLPIFAVDVQGKTTWIIALSDVGEGRCRVCVCYFGQSQGRIHLVAKESDASEQHLELCIWVLQDYDTQEWVLKDTVSVLELYGDESCRGGMSEYHVVDFHQDCNVICFTRKLSDELLMAYGLGRKEASVIATSKTRSWLRSFARYVPYFKESPALPNNH